MDSSGGPRRDFSPTEKMAVIALGISGGCIPTLQPLLLSNMARAGMISTAQIGQAAMAEAFGMAVAMTAAALWLKPERLRSIAGSTVLAALLLNLAAAFASGVAVVGLRGLAGLCSGLLLWMLVGLMARTLAPARLFAIYVTTQSVTALALSTLLAQVIAPRFGATGGYAVLAAMNLMLLPLTMRMVPPRYAGGDRVTGGRLPLGGVAGLFACALFLSGVMGFWVYVIPLAQVAGQNEAQVQTAILAAIAVQIAGGLAAIGLAGRLPPALANALGPLLAGGCIALFMSVTGPVAIFAALLLFAFAWMFVPPFQMPLLIRLDPSLRSAMLIGSAQLLGSAAGPLFASLALGRGAAGPAWAALGCMGGSLLCLAVAIGRSARPSASSLSSASA